MAGVGSLESLGVSRLTREPPPRYPAAMVNVTNHCNLRCKHCFVFRDVITSYSIHYTKLYETQITFLIPVRLWMFLR